MGMTDYTRENILNHVAGVSSWTMPAATWLSLHADSDPPANDGSGTEYDDRLEVTFDAAVLVSGLWVVSIDAGVTFTGLAAGTISYGSIWDDDTTGNMLWWGVWSTPTVVGGGGSFPVDPADVALQLVA